MIPIFDPSAEMTSGYLLIDASNYPRSLDCKPLPFCACVPGDLTNIMSLLPGLVDIRALDASQLRAVRATLTMQAAGTHAASICAVLNTEVEVEALSEHIGCLLSTTDEAGQPVFWRFFDPRVFSVAMTIFTTEQRRALLGPIHDWRLVWRGHWWRIAGHPAQWNRLFDIDLARPNEDQWPLIRLCRMVDQVLLQLERDSPLTPMECLRMQERSIVYLREGASEWNLSSPEELIDFAFLCVKYGLAFRYHLKFKQVKADLVTGRSCWFSFRQSFDSADLRALEKSHLR